MLKKLAVALPKGFVQKASLCVISALIVANSSILGFSSPIGVVISSILPLPYCFIFAASALLSEAIFGITAHSLGAAFASLIVCSVKLLQSQQSVKKNSFTQSICPFASYLICTLSFLLLFSSSFTDYIALLAFSVSIPTLIVAYNNQSSKQMMSLLFVAAITTLFGVDFVYFNVGRAFGIYAVLAIGFLRGAAFSCFAGILCAIAAALYSPAMFPSTVFVCIIGLICSGRGYKDKIRLPLYAVVTSVVCAALAGAGRYEICFVIDTFVAAVVFIFTEDKANRFITRFTKKSNESDVYLGVVNSYSQSRAYSLSALSNYIESLSNASLTYKPSDISSTLYSGICLSCKNHDSCFSDKLIEFSQAIKNCQKPHELISHAEKLKQRNEYMRLLSSKRLSRFQETVSILETLQNCVFDNNTLSDSVKNLDPIMTKKLTATLFDNKAEALNQAVFNDGSLFIEYPKHKQISEVRLCLLVSELMSVNYPMPEVSVYDSFARYIFSPKPQFCADYGTVQVSAKSDGCGDSYDCFIHRNTLYYILCDGMGTGKAAKVSSSLLVSLIKQQLMRETSASAAISLSALIMRLIELDESFATLDLLCVNLSTGECRFFKSGSCRSYLISEGITDIPAGGYPIGILSDNETKQSKFRIKSDSAIVMFSDGAKDIPYQLVEKTVRENLSVSSEEIAENILKNSQVALKHSQNDDITVAVIKIESRNS